MIRRRSARAAKRSLLNNLEGRSYNRPNVLASDDHLHLTLDRLLTSLRGPLEAALRAGSDKAADEARRQAQEQLAQLRAAAKKQNDDLRTSGEAQIAELKRMLEEIRRTAQTQIDTARRTLDTEVAAVRARANTELAAAQRTAQSQVAEVQQATEERLRGLTRELEDARQQLERVRGDVDLARAEADRARAEADGARRDIATARADAEAARQDAEIARLTAVPAPRVDSLADDLRALDEAGSLSDVLERLADGATRHAQRAALLIVRNGRLHAWQLLGFPQRAANDTVDLSVDAAGIAADALRDGRMATGGRLPAFAGAEPAGAPPRDAAAFPIMVGGVVVAVLYADAAGGPAGLPPWQDTLDVLSRYASRVLEAVTVQQATGARPVHVVAQPSHSTQARPPFGGAS
jgi:hypothetical protein